MAGAAPQPIRREGGEERPLGKKGARTRAQILAAAYEVLAEQGYGRTTVADVATAAGVSLGTVYQYFRDKGEIMATLVRLRVEELLDADGAAWEPARGRLGLRRVLAGFVVRYAESAAMQAVWEEVTHVDPELAALRRELSRRFTGAVERSLRDAAAAGTVRDDLDPAAMATALSAMVDRHCYVTYVFDPPPGGPPPVDEVIDLLTGLWADAIGLVETGGRRSPTSMS